SRITCERPVRRGCGPRPSSPASTTIWGAASRSTTCRRRFRVRWKIRNLEFRIWNSFGHSKFQIPNFTVLETRGADHFANDAVALAVEIQLAGGVDREPHVGAAAEHELGTTGQARALAAALVIRRFDDGKHRVVRLPVPAHLDLVNPRRRRRLAVVGRQHVLVVGVPDAAGGEIGEYVLAA